MAPYIWIPKYPIRKRKEIERVVEHVVESSLKGLEKPKVEVGGSPKYFSAKELERITEKAQRDELGKVRIVKDEEGRTFLKAGDGEVIEVKRKKFMVANLITGEKKEL